MVWGFRTMADAETEKREVEGDADAEAPSKRLKVEADAERAAAVRSAEVEARARINATIVERTVIATLLLSTRRLRASSLHARALGAGRD